MWQYLLWGGCAKAPGLPRNEPFWIPSNHLNGATGADTASYATATTPLTASLATDFATGEGSGLLSYVERLTGSAGADTLTVADTDPVTGVNAANILEGLGGADTLDAQEGTGNDTVNGGTESDICQTDTGDQVSSCP